MRKWLRTTFAVLVSAAAAFAVADRAGSAAYDEARALQNGAAAPPPNVRIDGVPPVPTEVHDLIASYGDYRQATLLAWHPTERRILVETTFGNVPQVHEVRAPGAARTQLTFFRDGIPVGGPASYSPDGRYMLLRKDIAAGAEDFQLFRYDFASGAVTRVTQGVTKAGFPVWARRSSRVAYDSPRRDGKNRDLWVMDPSDPSTDRLVAELRGGWEVLDWSPDDKELFAMEVVSPTERHLWRVDVATGEKKPLTERGGKAVRWGPAQVDRDGRFAYAIGNFGSDTPRVWRADLRSTRWTAVTPEGEPIEGFELSPDGRLLAVVFDRDAASELQFLEARTGRVRSKPSLPVGAILNLRWNAKSTEVAFTFQGARVFRDVYSVDVQSGRLDRWTTSETSGVNLASLPDAEIIRWKSFDGLEISGVMYRPSPRFNGPRPVIINVHGGPIARERPRNLGRSNHFRNDLGAAIIYPNIRGSSGRGVDFDRLDNGRLRENAIKDIGALLDWIATQPYLDKHRVMVTGGSYGGYIALAAGLFYGDRLRAVTSTYGMTDLVDFLQNTDIPRRENREGEYGDPTDPEMRTFLDSISPLPNAARFKVPVYLVHGKNDTRINLGQVERFAAALKANGTPVWLIVLEDQGHLQLPTAHNNFTTAALVLFAKQYLLN